MHTSIQNFVGTFSVWAAKFYLISFNLFLGFFSTTTDPPTHPRLHQLPPISINTKNKKDRHHYLAFTVTRPKFLSIVVNVIDLKDHFPLSCLHCDATKFFEHCCLCFRLKVPFSIVGELNCLSIYIGIENYLLLQQEYIRGISAWNFNLEDLKAQAALVRRFFFYLNSC